MQQKKKQNKKKQQAVSHLSYVILPFLYLIFMF